MSEDPIGFGSGETNLYGYGSNNPLSLKDPTGEAILLFVGAIVLILVYSKYANAPGPNDDIYDNDPAREMVGDIPYMVVGGVVISKALGFLAECINPLFRRVPLRIGRYKHLRKGLPSGEQANHLNQKAAFKDVIPSDEGVAVGVQGDAITQPGTPHYEFHKSLEKFWDQFRRGGAQAGSRPTNAQYDEALKEALKASGFSSGEVAKLVREAARQRAAYGLRPRDLVPRVPGRLPQKCK